MMLRIFLASSLIAATTPAGASSIRFEIGRRLIRLETRWRETTDAERRRAVVGEVQAAVQAFFGLRLQEVARDLDRAVAASEGRAVSWFEGLAVSPGSRLVDLGRSRPLVYRLDRLYSEGPTEWPVGAWCEVGIGEHVQRFEPAGAGPWEVSLSLDRLGEGDHVVVLRFGTGDRPQHEIVESLSRVDGVEARLANAATQLDSVGVSLESETARGWIARARLSREAAEPETFFPGHAELDLLAPVVAAAASGERWPGWRQSGERWFKLPVGSSRIPIRASVPAVGAGERRPMVVAVHGAGGSENLFFVGHGAGHLRRSVDALGWVFVTPGFAGDDADLGVIIDELCRLLPVDPDRVFLVGHSLGAARVLLAVAREPRRYAGIALLSGGGRVRPGMKAVSERFLVAAGSEDFGLAPSRAVANSLGIECRVYPGVEHLLVVSESLDDVMKFFRSRPALGQGL